MLGIFITVVVTLFAVSLMVFTLLFLLSLNSDRINKRKSLRAAPYHESAHAIIAMTTGMGFQEISIQENPENYGHMSYRDDNYRTDRHSSGGDTLIFSPREELENRIMVAMAGYVAEMLYCDLSHFPIKPIFNSDVQVINELIQDNSFLYKELGVNFHEYHSLMLKRTQETLEKEFAAHMKLVDTLKKDHVISEFEAWNLVCHELTDFPVNPYLETEPLSSL